MINLKVIADKALGICNLRGWSRHWKESGVILHLEVSEFIEAVRGKRGDPEKEAADVLFVLLSTCEKYGLLYDSIEAHLSNLANGAAVESKGIPASLRAGLPSLADLMTHGGKWIGHMGGQFPTLSVGVFMARPEEGPYFAWLSGFHRWDHDKLESASKAEYPCAFWPCDAHGNKVPWPLPARSGEGE